MVFSFISLFVSPFGTPFHGVDGCTQTEALARDPVTSPEEGGGGPSEGTDGVKIVRYRCPGSDEGCVWTGGVPPPLEGPLRIR